MKYKKYIKEWLIMRLQRIVGIKSAKLGVDSSQERLHLNWGHLRLEHMDKKIGGISDSMINLPYISKQFHFLDMNIHILLKTRKMGR